eukprot:2542852-Alexandrium_andersonii.AAC.1
MGGCFHPWANGVGGCNMLRRLLAFAASALAVLACAALKPRHEVLCWHGRTLPPRRCVSSRTSLSSPSPRGR